MPRLYGERRGELRAVVIRLVALDGASQTVVEVLIGFLVVERTRIVETAARRVAVGATLPVAAGAGGNRPAARVESPWRNATPPSEPFLPALSST